MTNQSNERITTRIPSTDKNLVHMDAEEFDKMMCATFPEMTRERSLGPEKSCMHWGFSVGSGWFVILYELCKTLQQIYKTTGILTVLKQVKEKFGTLRIYTDVENTRELPEEEFELWYYAIHVMVDHAESRSARTCEQCGSSEWRTKTRNVGWMVTMCPLHTCVYLKMRGMIGDKDSQTDVKKLESEITEEQLKAVEEGRYSDVWKEEKKQVSSSN